MRVEDGRRRVVITGVEPEIDCGRFPITRVVGERVIALFPLALHGGPLWEPMCYAQIGGLTAATFITLLLVPVIYSIVVLDLQWVKWESARGAVVASGSGESRGEGE